MTVEISQVETSKDRRDFYKLPRKIYAGETSWVEPLRVELKQRLNIKKNSFFRRAEVAMFLARKNGETVGRITAQIDRTAYPGDEPREGNFGFYEAIDDAEVAKSLFDAAANWLKVRKAKKMVGPYNFRLEDPAPGFLIKGFDLRPTFMMAYSRPYYIEHAKQAGLDEAMRLNAYAVRGDTKFPQEIQDRIAEAETIPGLSVRAFNMSRLNEDVEVIRTIFNQALKDNWGFVPFSEKQVRAMARDLKKLADPRIILFAEVHGAPVGVVINIPNYNDILHDCGGKLFPKGLYRMFFHKKMINSVRGYAMAVLPAYRSKGLGCYLLGKSWLHGVAVGYDFGEITWVLGNNTGMNDLAHGFGGQDLKQYSIVEKPL